MRWDGVQGAGGDSLENGEVAEARRTCHVGCGQFGKLALKKAGRHMIKVTGLLITASSQWQCPAESASTSAAAAPPPPSPPAPQRPPPPAVPAAAAAWLGQAAGPLGAPRWSLRPAAGGSTAGVPAAPAAALHTGGPLMHCPDLGGVTVLNSIALIHPAQCSHGRSAPRPASGAIRRTRASSSPD